MYGAGEASEQTVTISGEGSGPIEAFVNGIVEVLNEPLNIIDYHEHAMSTGKDARAICLLAIDDGAEGGDLRHRRFGQHDHRVFDGNRLCDESALGRPIGVCQSRSTWIFTLLIMLSLICSVSNR